MSTSLSHTCLSATVINELDGRFHKHVVVYCCRRRITMVVDVAVVEEFLLSVVCVSKSQYHSANPVCL